MRAPKASGIGKFKAELRAQNALYQTQNVERRKWRKSRARKLQAQKVERQIEGAKVERQKAQKVDRQNE